MGQSLSDSMEPYGNEKMFLILIKANKSMEIRDVKNN